MGKGRIKQEGRWRQKREKSSVLNVRKLTLAQKEVKLLTRGHLLKKAQVQTE